MSLPLDSTSSQNPRRAPRPAQGDSMRKGRAKPMLYVAPGDWSAQRSCSQLRPKGPEERSSALEWGRAVGAGSSGDAARSPEAPIAGQGPACSITGSVSWKSCVFPVHFASLSVGQEPCHRFPEKLRKLFGGWVVFSPFAPFRLY